MKGIRSTVEVLTTPELEIVHQASIEILETVGFRFSHDRVLKKLSRAGARVDYQQEIAWIPEDLVNEALLSARSKAKPRSSTSIKGAMTSQALFIEYPRKRRHGTREDILKGIVVGNHLPNIDTIYPIVFPSDVPAQIADIVCFQLLYTYSTKPSYSWILNESSVDPIIEMAEAYYGGPDKLRNQRALSYYMNSTSPLQLDHISLELGLMFVDRGLPTHVGPLLVAGLSGPVTFAGSLALANAEILGDMVLSYILDQVPYYGGSIHVADPTNLMTSFGAPHLALFGIAIAQMTEYYGLPKGGINVGLTDANTFDFQNGFERGMTAAFGLLAGASGVGMLGILGADQGASLEQLVIDNEWIDAMNFALRGFEVNEETLALDVIKSVGPGGNFIGELHTARHLRENIFFSDLFPREPWASWEAKGYQDVASRAHAKVEHLLREHYPPKLAINEELATRLEKIAKDVGRNLD